MSNEDEVRVEFEKWYCKIGVEGDDAFELNGIGLYMRLGLQDMYRGYQAAHSAQAEKIAELTRERDEARRAAAVYEAQPSIGTVLVFEDALDDGAGLRVSTIRKPATQDNLNALLEQARAEERKKAKVLVIGLHFLRTHTSVSSHQIEIIGATLASYNEGRKP